MCGSCWSFATTGAMEGALFLKVGAGTQCFGVARGFPSLSLQRVPPQTGVLTPLSQQVLIDCSWGFGNYACDGGEEWRAYEWIKKHGGIASTESYGPYLGQVRVPGVHTPHPPLQDMGCRERLLQSCHHLFVGGWMLPFGLVILCWGGLDPLHICPALDHDVTSMSPPRMATATTTSRSWWPRSPATSPWSRAMPKL